MSTEIVPAPAPALLKVEEARALLAQCARVDEAKQIRDKAEAIRAYLRRQVASREAQNDAAEIKLRAERRLGELLREQAAKKERATAGDRGRPRKSGHDASTSQKAPPPPPTLRELGIEPTSARRWQDVAAVPSKDFEAFVEKQRTDPRGEITTAGLRREAIAPMKRAARVEKLATLAAVGTPDLPRAKRFPVLYADPAWRYEQSGGNGAAESHYPTMSLAELEALDVPGVCTPDAVLFLWVTSPMIPDALHLLEAWGFRYKTSLVWVKDRLGTGFWARSRHELLFVAVRGSPPTPATDVRPDSVITAPRGKHSEKPEAVAEMIERAYPTLPKLELFARRARPKWTAWGNQAPGARP